MSERVPSRIILLEPKASQFPIVLMTQFKFPIVAIRQFPLVPIALSVPVSHYYREPQQALINTSLKHISRRPYCIEYAGSHSNSIAKRCKARVVLGWGTARELHGVDGFSRMSNQAPDSIFRRLVPDSRFSKCSSR